MTFISIVFCKVIHCSTRCKFSDPKKLYNIVEVTSEVTEVICEYKYQNCIQCSLSGNTDGGLLRSTADKSGISGFSSAKQADSSPL